MRHATATAVVVTLATVSSASLAPTVSEIYETADTADCPVSTTAPAGYVIRRRPTRYIDSGLVVSDADIIMLVSQSVPWGRRSARAHGTIWMRADGKIHVRKN